MPDLSPAACAAALAERFPALFGNEGPPRPIKLRIQADIQQRAPGVFSRKSLSVFLHRHTTSTAYLRALVAAPSRFDLDGAPAGEIAEEHRAAAREEVERRRALVQARRQAEAQARRANNGPRSSPQAGSGEQEMGAAPSSTSSASDSPEGDASPRPPRPPRPGRPDRGPRQGEASRENRPPRRGVRREDSSGGPQRAGHPDQRPRRPQPHAPHPQGARDARGPRGPKGPSGSGGSGGSEWKGPRPEARDMPRGPLGPEDAAQRDRLALLRAWESSPLTKANFCALKRLAEAEFDTVIEQARRERAG